MNQTTELGHSGSGDPESTLWPTVSAVFEHSMLTSSNARERRATYDKEGAFHPKPGAPATVSRVEARTSSRATRTASTVHAAFFPD